MNVRKKINCVLPWLALAAAYLFAVTLYVFYGECGLDSDISSEMVLANLLNEEGALITGSWYYSTELRVISPVPAYQLGLLIFPDNWHAAHSVGMAIMLAGVAAAMIYLGRAAGFKTAGTLSAAAVILPVSEAHRFLFSSGGFYTAYIILACVLTGLVLGMDRPRARAVRLAALALLGFAGGLSGVRMPMICGAPLMIACALEAYGALRNAASVKEAAKTPQARIALGAAVCTAAMLGGYLVNAKMLAASYHFAGYEESQLGSLNLAGILEQMRVLTQFFGYRANVPLMSMRGVCNMLVLGAVLWLALSVISGLCSRREMSIQQRIVLYFTVFALALGVFLNITMGEERNEYSVGYYLMGVFAMVLLAFAALERMKSVMPFVDTAAMLALTGIFALQSLVFVRNYMPKDELPQKEAAAWLAQNGYTSGYATFWNGNVLTELSDGALDVYAVNEWADGTLNPWLQKTAHFEELPAGKVFVYVDAAELAQGEMPFADEGRRVWASDSAEIYSYDSAGELIAQCAR